MFRLHASTGLGLIAVSLMALSVTGVGSSQQPGATARAQNSRAALLLIHGRDQAAGQGDSVRKAWLDAVDSGLKEVRANGRIPPAARLFYWYGDILATGEGCAFAFGADAFRAIGWNLWSQARDVLLKVAGQAPSVVQRSVIEWQLEDTAKYLGNGAVACAVDDGLKNIWNKLPPGQPVVVVAHSMGSMVLYKNLMTGLAGHDVYLITIGSMVGEAAVQRTVLGALAQFPAPVPRPVVWWRNIVNRGDVLAFKAEKSFSSANASKQPLDVFIDTKSEDRHSATGYIASAAAGELLRDAWSLATARK